MVDCRPVLIILLLTAVLSCTGCAETGSSGPRSETVTISGHGFNLELAIDEPSRTRGLMYKESVPEDGGMLFVFPEAQVRSFWMGNCFIDIDLIFLDGRGRITALHRMKKARPQEEGESDFAYQQRLPSYWSNYPAQFAIELRAGWLDRLNLHIDDSIELDLDRLKALAR
ncbi:MAG: DUF192 domain-containing protein [Phycisphaerales bacterium]|nr:MAG: DUF192 domain-containing protein [Phycisphaerales bacterium]